MGGHEACEEIAQAEFILRKFEILSLLKNFGVTILASF